MGSRGSGYVRKNGSAGTEQPGLTGEDKKWLKRISFDGQTAYVNPDNDRLIATTTFSGKVRFLDQAELENYRKTHDMQTGQVKKAYIHELARQAADG